MSWMSGMNVFGCITVAMMWTMTLRNWKFENMMFVAKGYTITSTRFCYDLFEECFEPSYNRGMKILRKGYFWIFDKDIFIVIL